MKSLILSTGTRYLIPLLLIFAFFLLLRGHNEPGGGFVGGLVASTAYVLYGIAYGVNEARKLLRIDPVYLVGLGLLTALISALIPVLAGETFMTGVWMKNEVPILGKLGTPLLFDTGVFLLVLGISLKVIFALAEEDVR
ncbi:MAG: Na+/H+ antiporter subunit B [Candidatus Kapaibacterium sp.]